MSVQIQASILDLNQEEFIALLHSEQSIRAVDDHVLCESKKEHVKEPFVTSKQSLEVKAFEEVILLNSIDNGQFFRTRLTCDTYWRSI